MPKLHDRDSAKQYKLSKIIWDNTSSSCLSELSKIPLSQLTSILCKPKVCDQQKKLTVIRKYC